MELCRRAARAQRGTTTGDALDVLALEAGSDRQALADLMAALGVRPRRAKAAAGWAGEKLGRLKLNGSLLSRSPLSDVVELDGLRLAVEWKAAGWRLLQALGDFDARLAAADLDDLLDRAEDQATRIEHLRLAAARDRLST